MFKKIKSTHIFSLDKYKYKPFTKYNKNIHEINKRELNLMAAAEAAAVVPEKEPTPTACKEGQKQN